VAPFVRSVLQTHYRPVSGEYRRSSAFIGGCFALLPIRASSRPTDLCCPGTYPHGRTRNLHTAAAPPRSPAAHHAGRVGRWRTGAPDPPKSRRSCLQRPLSEPCVRFSLTRLSTGHSPAHGTHEMRSSGGLPGGGSNPVPSGAGHTPPNADGGSAFPLVVRVQRCEPPVRERRHPTSPARANSPRAGNTDTSP